MVGGTLFVCFIVEFQPNLDFTFICFLVYFLATFFGYDGFCLFHLQSYISDRKYTGMTYFVEVRHFASYAGAQCARDVGITFRMIAFKYVCTTVYIRCMYLFKFTFTGEYARYIRVHAKKMWSQDNSSNHRLNTL